MNKTEQALGILQAIRALAQVKTNSDTNAKTIWSIKAVAEAGISVLEEPREVLTGNIPTPFVKLSKNL